METIFVSGANSLLATNVIVELLSRGYFVKGILRNAKSFQHVPHPNLRLIQGDLNHSETFADELKNCDCVIHVASVTDQDLLHYEDYKKFNVVATQSFLDLSVKEKVKTFVYVSSANAFGYGSKANPGNECVEIKKPFSKSYYAKSKSVAQQMVLSYQNKMKVVVVNPTFMLGAYDSKPSSGKLILMGYRKKIIFYPPGGKNFIHVADAAMGAVNAMELGKSGEAYILANENLSYKEFFQKLSATTKNKSVYIKVPRVLLLSAGCMGSLLRFFGIKTNVSFTNMRIVCVNNFYSNLKASHKLNLKYQPVEKAIDDGVCWFIEKGMIE